MSRRFTRSNGGSLGWNLFREALQALPSELPDLLRLPELGWVALWP